MKSYFVQTYCFLSFLHLSLDLGQGLKSDHDIVSLLLVVLKEGLLRPITFHLY